MTIPSQERALPPELVEDLEALDSDLLQHCHFTPHKEYGSKVYTCTVDNLAILWTKDEDRHWYVADIANDKPSEQEIKEMLLAHSRSQSTLPSRWTSPRQDGVFLWEE